MDWRRLDPLFDRATALQPDEQSAFVEKVGGEHPGLVAEEEEPFNSPQ